MLYPACCLCHCRVAEVTTTMTLIESLMCCPAYCIRSTGCEQLIMPSSLFLLLFLFLFLLSHSCCYDKLSHGSPACCHFSSSAFFASSTCSALCSSARSRLSSSVTRASVSSLCCCNAFANSWQVSAVIHSVRCKYGSF